MSDKPKLIPMKVAVSIEEQEAIVHNRWRYNELRKLRRGQANRYQETSYR